MEPLSIMMLTVPIYFPIIQSFGYMTPDEREDLLNDALIGQYLEVIKMRRNGILFQVGHTV